jgi:hypothetical protein
MMVTPRQLSTLVRRHPVTRLTPDPFAALGAWERELASRTRPGPGSTTPTPGSAYLSTDGHTNLANEQCEDSRTLVHAPCPVGLRWCRHAAVATERCMLQPPVCGPPVIARVGAGSRWFRCDVQLWAPQGQDGGAGGCASARHAYGPGSPPRKHPLLKAGRGYAQRAWPQDSQEATAGRLLAVPCRVRLHVWRVVSLNPEP